MESDIIKISHLNKSFGEVKAVNDLSFRVKKGELFAFLGVNGAGKSTTISILCGLLKKDSGTVQVNGIETDKAGAQTKRMLGVVFQDSVLDKPLTVKENLMSRAALYGITGNAFDKRLQELVEILDFDEFLNRPVGKLSGGQRRRIDIARALLHRPELLILDEPINGLDPQGIAEMRDMIQKLNEEHNMTILISSHILEELSKIATDYGIIHNGVLVQELTREELLQRCRERIEITMEHPEQALPVLDGMKIKNYQVVDKEHIHVFERLNDSAIMNMELAKAGCLVKGISMKSEELENYFLNLTGGEKNA